MPVLLLGIFGMSESSSNAHLAYKSTTGRHYYYFFNLFIYKQLKIFVLFFFFRVLTQDKSFDIFPIFESYTDLVCAVVFFF